MADQLDMMVAACRSRGGRMTPQRLAVLRELVEAKRPLSPYDLLSRVKPSYPAASAASTYRCLDFLLEQGLVHRLETTRSFVACDHPDHPHAVQFLICTECGTVVEAEDKRVASATKSLGDRLGFSVDRRTVELTGVCASCQTEGGRPGA